MTIKRFISYSIVIHLLAMSFLFIRPPRQEQKGSPLFARLVTPGEISETESFVPLPKTAPLPQDIETHKPEVMNEKSEKPQTTDIKPQISIPKDSISQIPQVMKGQRPGSMGDSSADGQFKMPPGTGGFSFPLKRENLFDREVISESAQKQEDKTAKSTITFDAKEFKYYGYMRRLREKVEGIWQYPSDAAMRGLYGDLYINFTIKKNGSLGSVDLVRTSGYRSLDEAAIKALKEAAPYWPLPEEWKEEALTIKGHFIYSLQGPYIR
ncbi:MAG: TonB family protein [Thermodesulfovibrionales bacterium]|nr:TonB family protein [Thermodesulfovibrionales bacterium]